MVEQLFYYNWSTEKYTLKAPVEFQASVGDDWTRTYDSDVDGYFYYNTETEESRNEPPAINPRRLQEIIQASHRKKELKMKVSDSGNEATAAYKAQWADFDAEAKQARREENSALLIQRNFRRHQAQQRYSILKEQHQAATLLQRIYRGRMAKRSVALSKKQAIKIVKLQAMVRGFLARQFEKMHREERILHRFRRQQAVVIQRHFRGYIGRRKARQFRAEVAGPRSYFEWKEARKGSVVKRVFTVWDERIMVNTPDVLFYLHQITGQCVWEKPPEWKKHDQKQVNAIFWRFEIFIFTTK